jgi:hypothetical protein
MNLNMLPTVEDMLMDYQWIRNDLKTTDKEPTVSEISDILASKIKEIWNRATIHTVTVTRIVQLIKGHHDKYIKLLWYPVSKRNEQYERKVKDFREQASQNLFDIATCKCADFSSCKCDKSSRVPTLEQEFIQDQRSEHKMMIGAIDRVTTRKLENRHSRKSQEEARHANYQQQLGSPQVATRSVNPESIHFDSDTKGSLMCSTPEESDSDLLSAVGVADTSSLLPPM